MDSSAARTSESGVTGSDSGKESVAENFCMGMDQLVESHCMIVKMVRNMEKLFAPCLQCFYLAQVVTLCLELYLVAYRLSIGEYYKREEVTWQSIIIAQTFFVFFLVSIKASYVFEEVTRSMHDAESSVDVLRRGLPFTAMDKEKFHFNEVVTSLTSSPICITGGGYFYINRPFIVTVIGAVLSYFIIILQLMLPSAKNVNQTSK